MYYVKLEFNAASRVPSPGPTSQKASLATPLTLSKGFSAQPRVLPSPRFLRQCLACVGVAAGLRYRGSNTPLITGTFRNSLLQSSRTFFSYFFAFPRVSTWRFARKARVQLQFVCSQELPALTVPRPSVLGTCCLSRELHVTAAGGCFG